MNPEHPPSALRGILMLLAALAFFVTMDSTSKHLAGHVPVPMLVWARYTIHCLLMVAVLAPSMGRRLLRTRRLGLQVMRAACLVIVTVLAIYSFRLLPIAEATAILFLAPLLVTVAAGPLLGERVSAARWLAVGTGFVGVMLIARPGSGLAPAGIALAGGAALAFAGYQLLTRALSGTEQPLTTLFYTALVGALLSTAALPWTWELPPLSTADVVMVGSLGICGGLGHFLLIRAFREASASTLAPIMYAQLGFATLSSGLVFGQWPDLPAFVGIGVIALAGVMIALDARRAQAAFTTRAEVSPVTAPRRS